MATHSSVLAGEIPWTEEPGATVRGVPKSRTWPLNKAKGKLFSLSVSLCFCFPASISLTSIWVFLGFFTFIFFSFFQNIPVLIHSFTFSVSLHFSGLQSLLIVSILLYLPYSTSPVSLNYSLMCPLIQSACSLGACWMEALCWLGDPQRAHALVGVASPEEGCTFRLTLWPLSHPINISWTNEWMVTFYILWLFSVVTFTCLVLIYKM